MLTDTLRPGLVVVDASLNLLASNAEAVQILTFPVPPDKVRRPDPLLKEKIRSYLRDRRSGSGSGFVHQFLSGKRTYLCRCFPVNTNLSLGAPSPAHVLVFERRTNNEIAITEVCDRFGLTRREQEAIQLLLRGLTTKEIASFMRISPNTVKSFLRLVTVKLGVSTRSGIVSKILGSQTD